MNLKNLMKHSLIIVILLLISTLSALSRDENSDTSIIKEFKIAKYAGKLIVNIPGAIIEGYNGSEIILSQSKLTNDEVEKELKKASLDMLAVDPNIAIKPPVMIRTGEEDRSKGLMMINEFGVSDNTGVGVHVTESAGAVTISQVSKRDIRPLLIKVPKSLKITYNYTNALFAGKVICKNLENELEINTNYNSVELVNVTGPLTVKTIYGNVEAILSNVIKSPLSVISIYGFLDLSVAASTKANIGTKSDYGDVFISPELKLDLEKSQSTEIASSWANQQIKSKLNGGGVDISLKTSYGRIYLRSKN